MSIIFVFISQKRHVISKNNIRFGFSAILKLFKILQKLHARKIVLTIVIYIGSALSAFSWMYVSQAPSAENLPVFAFWLFVVSISTWQAEFITAETAVAHVGCSRPFHYLEWEWGTCGTLAKCGPVNIYYDSHQNFVSQVGTQHCIKAKLHDKQILRQYAQRSLAPHSFPS